jgi:hypothetical protein
MKTTVRYIASFVVIVMLYTCCGKEQTEFIEQKTIIYHPQDWGFGFAQAKKNGLQFDAGGWVNIRPKCDGGSQLLEIGLFTEDGYGFTREELPLITAQLSKVPFQYDLPMSLCGINPFPGTGYSLLDTEVLEDSYIVDYTINNWIRIEVADTFNNVLQGAFRLRFVIDPDSKKTNLENPDTIDFTDGKFKLKFFR